MNIEWWVEWWDHRWKEGGAGETQSEDGLMGERDFFGGERSMCGRWYESCGGERERELKGGSELELEIGGVGGLSV